MRGEDVVVEDLRLDDKATRMHPQKTGVAGAEEEGALDPDCRDADVNRRKRAETDGGSGAQPRVREAVVPLSSSRPSSSTDPLSPRPFIDLTHLSSRATCSATALRPLLRS